MASGDALGPDSPGEEARAKAYVEQQRAFAQAKIDRAIALAGDVDARIDLEDRWTPVMPATPDNYFENTEPLPTFQV